MVSWTSPCQEDGSSAVISATCSLVVVGGLTLSWGEGHLPLIAITSNSGKVIIQKEGEMKRQLTVVAIGFFYCNQLILFSPNISTIIVGAI